MASNLCGHSDAVSGLCSAHRATEGAGSDAHRGARPVSAMDLVAPGGTTLAETSPSECAWCTSAVLLADSRASQISIRMQHGSDWRYVGACSPVQVAQEAVRLHLAAPVLGEAERDAAPACGRALLDDGHVCALHYSHSILPPVACQGAGSVKRGCRDHMSLLNETMTKQRQFRRAIVHGHQSQKCF